MNINKSQIDLNKKYLKSHNVATYIEEMMTAIIEEKPDELLNFMINYLQKRASQVSSNLPLPMKSEICPNLTESLNSNVNSNLNEEFHLVAENDSNMELPADSETISSVKGVRNSSKSKEILLKQLNEEREVKANEKLLLETIMNSKEEEADNIDPAIALSEDPELYSSEFNVHSENSVMLKPQKEILVVKQITNNITNNKASVNLSICANCSKLFHYDNSAIIKSPSERDYDVSKASLIMDDIESASQVDGPRKICDEVDCPKYSRKKISVSDFVTHSKAWPVLDTSSESSTKNITNGSKQSNRNCP